MGRTLAYLGNKTKLLDWLEETMLEVTGWESLEGKFLGDLFSGSGVVTHRFRERGAATFSNDMELCSAIVTKALGCSTWSLALCAALEQLNGELASGFHLLATPGFFAREYSPLGGRAFWSEENARRLDYLRMRIDEWRELPHEHAFLLASLISTADKLSNCPGTYGRWCQEFKKSALKPLCLRPLHTNETAPRPGSSALSCDSLTMAYPTNLDAVYLDIPYNKRQYSKNVFPISVLTLPAAQQDHLKLGGKTGIPQQGCYLSPFSQSQEKAGDALRALVQCQNAEWLFMSYSDEATMPRDAVVAILETYGEVTLRTHQHARYKSMVAGNTEVTELLYCVHKWDPSGAKYKQRRRKLHYFLVNSVV